MHSSRTVGNVFVYVTVEGPTVSNITNVGQDSNYDRNVGSLCQSQVSNTCFTASPACNCPCLDDFATRLELLDIRFVRREVKSNTAVLDL